MKEIFTIGYSCFKIDDFVKVLKKFNINSLIDVRSNPVSMYHEDYNKSYLEKVLKSNGIIYRNYKKEFGARQEDPKYHQKGYLDFSQFSKSEIFLEGVRKIEAGIRLNYSFVLMCAEKDPSTCHRNIMVAKEFFKKGYKIKNILSDGSYESQEELEQRLIGQYFPDRIQMSLFGDELTHEEMVQRSYDLRNSEIGYRSVEEKKVSVS